MAAEYGGVEAAGLLLDRRAEVEARSLIDEAGVGGQTPIFHAVTQFQGWGLPMTHVLLERGADMSVRVRLPGPYERPDELVQCTAHKCALRFPGVQFPAANEKTLSLLRERGGME